MRKVVLMVMNLTVIPLLYWLAFEVGYNNLYLLNAVAIIIQLLLFNFIFYNFKWKRRILAIIASALFSIFYIFTQTYVSVVINRPTGFLAGINEAIFALGFGWLNFTIIFPVMMFIGIRVIHKKSLSISKQLMSIIVFMSALWIIEAISIVMITSGMR